MKNPLAPQHVFLKRSSLTITLLFVFLIIAACGEIPNTNAGGPSTTPTTPSTAPQQNATPTPTPRPLPTEPLTAIRFLDASNGWALTQHAVLRTSDGGKSWHDVSPQAPAGKNWLTMNLFGLVSDLLSGGPQGGMPRAASNHALAGRFEPSGVFQSDQRAWVFVPRPLKDENQSGLHMLVWRTTDGGQSWASSSFDDADSIDRNSRAQFIDAQHGWLLLGTGAAAGSTGVHLYRTTDGGQSWGLIAAAPGTLPLSGLKDGPTFVDANHGWITDSIGALSDALLLYRSDDGGVSWNKMQLPTIPNLTNAYYNATAPVFFGKTGYLPVNVSLPNVNNAQPLAIYQTTDGGQSWKLKSAPNPATGAGVLSDHLYIADTLHFWALSQDGVSASVDGGATWQKVSSTPSGILTADMSFVNAQEGWISDANAVVLYHTTDGGHSWERIDYKFFA